MGTMLRKVRKVVSNIKNIPANIKQRKVEKQDRYDKAVMDEYEQKKDIPIDPANESNPLFRLKVNADEVRYRRDPAFRADIDRRKKELGLD